MSTTLPSADFISNFVEQQFPEFYREEGPDFVAFVKAYYEWLETTNSRNVFATRDIDTTAEEFLNHFRLKYLSGIPSEVAGNNRFLLKHVLDLYRSKGSEEGIKLLLRLLYNEEATIYQPATDVLRASDGVWIEKYYIEVPDNFEINKKYDQQFITGVTSGATAFVDSYQRLFIKDKIINVFYLTNINGNFIIGEQIYYDVNQINELTPFILGSPTSLTVESSNVFDSLGDILTTSNLSGKIGLKAVVSNTYNIDTGFINFKIINGGSGYSNNFSLSIDKFYPGANGTGATFTNIVLSNTSNFTYVSNLIDYAPFNGEPQFINTSSAGVNSSFDYVFINNNKFANGDVVNYIRATDNTVNIGLANNADYYVIGANSSAFRLSNTYNGLAVNLTSGASENGHSFTGYHVSTIALNAPTYSGYLNNANVNTKLQDAFTEETITIGTISQLVGINPGTDYNTNVVITINDNIMPGFNLSDNKGGFLGNNAIIYGDLIFGTGVPTELKIKDSGVGYNLENELITMYVDSNTNQTVSARVHLGPIGKAEGFWDNTKGFISSDKYIEDNNYYQEYSYEIRLSKSIDKYLSILKEVMHPVGNKIFGLTSIVAQQVNGLSPIFTDVEAGDFNLLYIVQTETGLLLQTENSQSLNTEDYVPPV